MAMGKRSMKEAYRKHYRHHRLTMKERIVIASFMALGACVAEISCELVPKQDKFEKVSNPNVAIELVVDDSV